MFCIELIYIYWDTLYFTIEYEWIQIFSKMKTKNAWTQTELIWKTDNSTVVASPTNKDFPHVNDTWPIK